MKIDRERLIKLHLELCKDNSCHRCSVKGLQSCVIHLMTNLLEQNPDLITGLPQNTEQIPLPVKTTWTLKPEFLPLYKSITGHIPESTISDIPDEIKPFYNAKDETDYSKVPIGAVVEINNFEYVGIIDQIESNCMCLTISSHSSNRFYIPFIDIKSLIILKLPEGK